MPIVADLEAFSPGWLAAHDVRGRAVIYISQKSTFMYHILVQRASSGRSTAANAHTALIQPSPTVSRYKIQDTWLVCQISSHTPGNSIKVKVVSQI